MTNSKIHLQGSIYDGTSIVTLRSLTLCHILGILKLQ